MHKIYNPYKPLSIISDKAGAYVRKYDKTKQLVLYPTNEKNERMVQTIRYLTMLKSSIFDFY